MGKKVSCICITHRRINLLRRSIRCFQKQTYSNKQLIVLYTKDDEETNEFAKKNNYPRLTIKEDEGLELMTIESLEDKSKQYYEITTNERISIRIGNSYLQASKDGKVMHSQERGDMETFTIEKTVDGAIFQTCHGTWLTKTNQRIGQTNSKDALKTFPVIVGINSKGIILNREVNEEEIALYSIRGRITSPSNNTSDIIFIEIDYTSPLSLGSKRNIAINMSSGDYICVWDDDDFYSQERLYNQMNFLAFTRKVGCTLANIILYDRTSEIAYATHTRNTGWEPTLLCLKSEMPFYKDLNRHEDTPILNKLYLDNKLSVMEDPYLYIYNYHGNNTSTNSNFSFILKYASKLDEEESIQIKGILEAP